MRRSALLALALLLLAGCADFRLRVQTRIAVLTAPPCAAILAPWCTTPEEAGVVYYVGAPFSYGRPETFCRCPRRAR